MLEFLLAALTPKLADADARRVIDHQIFALGNPRGRLYDVAEITAREIAVPHFLRVDTGFHREDTVDQLFLAHLEREYHAGEPVSHRGVLHDIQHEGRLTHGGTCRNQHEIGGLQTA